MSQQQLTGGEVQVIALAAAQGTPYVDVLFHNTLTPACGSCGRMIHHPDCAQLRREREEERQT